MGYFPAVDTSRIMGSRGSQVNKVGPEYSIDSRFVQHRVDHVAILVDDPDPDREPVQLLADPDLERFIAGRGGAVR